MSFVGANSAGNMKTCSLTIQLAIWKHVHGRFIVDVQTYYPSIIRTDPPVVQQTLTTKLSEGNAPVNPFPFLPAHNMISSRTSCGRNRNKQSRDFFAKNEFFKCERHEVIDAFRWWRDGANHDWYESPNRFSVTPRLLCLAFSIQEHEGAGWNLRELTSSLWPPQRNGTELPHAI